MHRALGILDLVHLLCSELGGDLHQYGFGPDASRNLAALSRTCKTFQDPALDVLWQHQKNAMANILMCMPDDLWLMGPDGKKVLDLARPIVTTDWDRPLLYMCRVKKFTFDDKVMPSLQLFESLSLSFPGDHFFPNLRVLGWYSQLAAANLPMIRLFLSPTITRINLTLTHFHHLSLLPTLSVKCRDIKEANMTCSTTDDLKLHGLRPMSLFVRGLETLESLSTYELDQAAFMHLARLPNFKSLHIGQREGFSPSWKASDEGIFSSLRDLQLRSATPESVGLFLWPFHNSPLTSLEIWINPSEVPTPNFYSSIAEGLSASSRTTLRKLTVRDPSGEMPPIISDDMIPSFFAFPHLTSLRLESRNGFDLDDDTLSRMAVSWPRMESLELAVKSHTHAFIPRATLRSLHTFGQYCPHLRDLEIQFDASDVPSIHIHAPQNTLETLSINGSSISAPVAAVASFLSRVFPNLSEVHTGYWEWEGTRDLDDSMVDSKVIHHRRWKEVERLLPAYVPPEQDDEEEEEDDD
ncbi:hypothetical protein FB451DRAFT_367685 [Mycena latifolia]|nr:hypothetical protein FB451DRAFT_367685 [Mycena latifolia]